MLIHLMLERCYLALHEEHVITETTNELLQELNDDLKNRENLEFNTKPNENYV